MKIRTIIMLVVLMIASFAQADVYMKQKVTQDAFQMMGQSQPATDVEVSVWMTDKGMRSDNPKQSAIVKPDEKVMILLKQVKDLHRERKDLAKIKIII